MSFEMLALRGLRVGCLMIAAVTGGACSSVHTLPPRPAPAAVLPALAMPSTPVAAGHARVVIDTTDGPMDVVAQTDASFASSAQTRSGWLCRTPCVVDLPFGSYTLYFSGLPGDSARGDVAKLQVRQGLNVLRRAPGKYESPNTDSAGLGIGLLVAGSTALGVGLALAGISNEVPAGVAVATVGFGTAIAGTVLMVPARAEQQAGATTSWNVPPQSAEVEKPTIEGSSAQ